MVIIGFLVWWLLILLVGYWWFRNGWWFLFLVCFFFDSGDVGGILGICVGFCCICVWCIWNSWFVVLLIGFLLGKYCIVGVLVVFYGG